MKIIFTNSLNNDNAKYRSAQMTMYQKYAHHLERLVNQTTKQIPYYLNLKN